MTNWWIGWVVMGVTMVQCYQILQNPQVPWVQALPLIFSFESLGFALMLSQVPWLRIIAIGSAAVWFVWAWVTDHYAVYLFVKEKRE